MSTPGTANGPVVVLVVVVLVPIAELLVPGVIVVVLRGRPGPRIQTNGRTFDDGLMVNAAECSAALPSIPPDRGDVCFGDGPSKNTVSKTPVTAAIRDDHAHRDGP